MIGLGPQRNRLRHRCRSGTEGLGRRQVIAVAKVPCMAKAAPGFPGAAWAMERWLIERGPVRPSPLRSYIPAWFCRWWRRLNGFWLPVLAPVPAPAAGAAAVTLAACWVRL